MEVAIEVLVRGSAIGLMYSLMGVGLALVYGVMKTLNFAYGEFYTVGGYLFAVTSVSMALPLYAAVPLAVAGGAAVAWVIELLVLRPVTRNRVERPMEYTLIVTLALIFVMQQVFTLLFGAFSRQPASFAQGSLSILGVSLDAGRAVAGVGGLIVLGLLFLFLRYTWTGRQIRATSQNRYGADVIGIRTTSVTRTSFVIGGALAAVAGVLLSPIYSIYPTAGENVVIKAFIIIAIAGMGSIIGAALAGWLLGVIELALGVYVSASYTDIYAFLILIVFLIVKPAGLFGQKVREA